MRKHRDLQWVEGAIRVSYVDPNQLDPAVRDDRCWQYACDLCGDIGYERTKAEAVSIADGHRRSCNGEDVDRKAPKAYVPLAERIAREKAREAAARGEALAWAAQEVRKPGVLHAIYGYVGTWGEVICRESFSDEAAFRARCDRLWSLGCTTIAAMHA